MLFGSHRHRRIAALAAAATLTGATVHTQSQSQPPVIRSGVDLVVVDVHVVDRSGQPITTLTPEDFEVSIDRGRRKVVSADLVQYGRAATASSDQATPLPAASAPASAAGRRFILAIDEHSFRPASAKAAMRAASGFIDQLLPTDLVGLYTYPTGASHSDLTTDHAAVRRGLEKVVGQLDVPLTRYNLSKSEIVDISSGDKEALSKVAARECRGFDPNCTRAIQGEAIALAGMFEMQVTQSLGGLRQLFEGLTQLEGRKTLVLISGGLFSSDRGDGRVRMQSDITQIGRQAALSNTNLYVLHMDSSFIDAFSERRGPSPTFFRDSNQLAAGLEIVSGSAGGALLRVQAVRVRTRSSG